MRTILQFSFLVLTLSAGRQGCHAEEPGWLDLFNGKDLSGWHLREANGVNGCRVEDGILVSKREVDEKRSSYLVSDLEFLDFQMQVEFRVPKGSNAGLYLQGRYEIQILDSYGRPVDYSMCGALYKRIAPQVNVCRPPGEWQTFDITFRAPRYDAEGEVAELGRLTVLHNGVKTLDDVTFVGPTGGGWMDQYEGEPGPLVIQTDHGDVDFRMIRIRGTAAEKSFPQPAPGVLQLAASQSKGPDGYGHGIALDWRTPHHYPAAKFLVYRGTSSDFPADNAHKRGEVRWWPPYTDGWFREAGDYFYKVVPLGFDGIAGQVAGPVSARGEPNQVDDPDLSKCGWLSASCKGGSVQRNQSFSRNALTVAGKKYKSGFGVQAPSAIEFLVGDVTQEAQNLRLRGVVGIDGSVPKDQRAVSEVSFVVEGDGKVLLDTGPLTFDSGARELDVPVPAGTQVLRLRVDPGASDKWDHADWAELRLEQVTQPGQP